MRWPVLEPLQFSEFNTKTFRVTVIQLFLPPANNIPTNAL